MSTYIIIRYGEIWLKGRKRSYFEQQLQKNAVACLQQKSHPFDHVERRGGRILISSPRRSDALAQVSGITSFSFSRKTIPTVEAMEGCLRTYFLTQITSPFCVRVKRLEKTTNQTSQELERALGAFIVRETGHTVNLKHPSTTLGVELYAHDAFLFIDEQKGRGGLPQTQEGNVLLLLETEQDLIAGKLIIKRGCIPTVMVKNPPLFAALQAWCPGVHLQPIKEYFYKDYDFIVAGTQQSHPNMLLPLEGLDDEWGHML